MTLHSYTTAQTNGACTITFTSTVDEKQTKKKKKIFTKFIILILHYKGSVLKFVTLGLRKDAVLHRKCHTF